MAQFIDVTSQEVTPVPGDATPVQCSSCLLELRWLPSGVALVAAVSDGSGGVVGLQTYALDGTPGALLPVHGVPAGIGAWSPDGRYVIVSDLTDDRMTLPAIVDVTTGGVVRSLPGPDVRQPSWSLTQAQWIDDSRFLTWAPIATDAFSASGYRAIASLWSIDGELLERWIPPTEIVRIDPGPTSAPLVIHLG
jgi:hypothetical protein